MSYVARLGMHRMTRPPAHGRGTLVVPREDWSPWPVHKGLPEAGSWEGWLQTGGGAERVSHMGGKVGSGVGRHRHLGSESRPQCHKDNGISVFLWAVTGR